MNAEVLNSFVSSFNQALSMFSSNEIIKKEIKALNALNSNTDLHVFLGIAGDLTGTVIFSAQKANALKIASLMAGMPFEEVDEISASALQELLNMTSGGASTKLSEMQIQTDITPPTLVTGTKLDIRMPLPLISIALETNQIPFYLNLSMKENIKKVLVIDSVHIMRKRAAEIINLNKSLKLTDECSDLQSTVASIKSNIPNIVLISLNEPADTYTIIELKKYFPQLKIVAATKIGQPLPGSIKQLVDRHVEKPYDPEKLLFAIKQ